jgi:hypothetical protein
VGYRHLLAREAVLAAMALELAQACLLGVVLGPVVVIRALRDPVTH